MKNRKIIAVLSALLLLTAMLLLATACGDEPTPENPPDNNDGTTPVTYRLSMKDYDGKVPSGFIVIELYQGEEMINQARMNDEGVATFSQIPGDYTFKVVFPDGQYLYDESLAVFSKDVTNVDLTLYNALGDSQKIYIPCEVHTDADGDEVCDECETSLSWMFGGKIEYDAVGLYEGASIVTIDRAKMSYFIFTPTKGGIYEFSYEIDGEATFGNFGSPHYVMSNSSSEVVDGKFTVEIPDTSINEGEGGTLQMVIGLGSDTARTAVIKIERTGNYVPPMPFEDVLPDPNMKKYDSILNNELVDIDITDPTVTVVYNESDGFYHYGTADGPVVLVKLTVAGNSNLSSLTLPSFVEICSTDRLCKYFYDGEGNLVSKQSYNYLIEQYAALVGSKGVLPLDEKMASAIKNSGEHKGWWGDSSAIFTDEDGVVAENAWLFACCYEVEGVYGSSDKPINVTPVAESDAVELAVKAIAGEEVTVKVNTTAGNLKITGAAGVTVTVDGSKYTAGADGVIEITVQRESVFTVTSESDAVIHIICITA